MPEVAAQRIRTTGELSLVLAIHALRRSLSLLARAAGSASRRTGALADRVLEVEYGYAYRYFTTVSTQHDGPYFLNWGLKVPAAEAPALDPADEADRLSIQLYHRVTAGIDLAGKSVLEVSCGHGGGSRYLAHAMRPRRLVAVDINPRAIDLCQARRHEPGLEYQVGDAMALPFEAGIFDAVLSVEASHRYPSLTTFVGEARRVLRPGGYLMFVDLRMDDASQQEMERVFEQSGMEILEVEDLASMVVAVLDESAATRPAMLATRIPRLLLPLVLDGWGTPGSPGYEALKSGAGHYTRYLLREPATAGRQP